MYQTEKIDSFINENNISSYTCKEFTSFLRNKGFEIVDINSQIAKNYFQILDTYKGDASFFICNDKGIKAVFADLNLDEDIINFNLARLIHLSDVRDSRFVDEKTNLEAITFAVLLKERILISNYENKSFRRIKNFFSAICACLVVVFSIITGIMYYVTDADNVSLFGDDENSDFTIFSSDADISKSELTSDVIPETENVERESDYRVIPLGRSLDIREFFSAFEEENTDIDIINGINDHIKENEYASYGRSQYHLKGSGCKYIPTKPDKLALEVIYSSKEEAEANGKTPCDCVKGKNNK